MSAVIHYAPRSTDAERLGNEIAELCSYIHAATCRLLELIREFDERRCWAEQGFRSCVEWLNFHCGLGPSAAREHLRVANALPELQKIRDTFADGRLGYSKVRGMTRVATPDNEDFRMTVATHGTANHVVVHTQADNTAQLENGPCVSAETLERVSCDCSVTEIEENQHGEALNIGRHSRTLPPAIRRALKARDGGCRFPGCMNHKFVDGHHIRHWSKGGDTSLDDLVLLCRHHHHLVHESGVDCRKGRRGEVYFVDRREQRLTEFQQTPRVLIEATMAWMYRKFERRCFRGNMQSEMVRRR